MALNNKAMAAWPIERDLVYMLVGCVQMGKISCLWRRRNSSEFIFFNVTGISHKSAHLKSRGK